MLISHHRLRTIVSLSTQMDHTRCSLRIQVNSRSAFCSESWCGHRTQGDLEDQEVCSLLQSWPAGPAGWTPPIRQPVLCLGRTPVSVTELGSGVASFWPLLLASTLGLAGFPERRGLSEPKRRAPTIRSWNLWTPGLRRQHELTHEATPGG